MEQRVLNPDVLLVIGSVESQYDEGQFDKTDLVCKEDGREVLDMESLKEHLKEGHKVFYLVGPKSFPDERSRNIDLVVRLYRELMKGAAAVDIEMVEGKMYKWAAQRRFDLHVSELVD